MDVRQKQTVHVHIRWSARRDLPELLQIDQLSFGDDPFTEDDFLRVNAHKDIILMSAEVLGADWPKVIGYVLFEQHKRRLEILRLAVHPGWRRLSVGWAMAEKLKNKLSPVAKTHLSCNVPETNLPAQLFLKAQGFVCVKTLPRFFEDTREDAYRMVYRVHSWTPDLGGSE